MRFVEDLILARDKRAGRKAAMHVVEDGNKFSVVNDLLGGRLVYTGETVQDCWDWYLDRLIGGLIDINC